MLTLESQEHLSVKNSHDPRPLINFLQFYEEEIAGVGFCKSVTSCLYFGGEGLGGSVATDLRSIYLDAAFSVVAAEV